MNIPPEIKKHAPLVIGGIAGIVIIWYVMRGRSSASTASSAGPDYGGMAQYLAASASANAANGSLQLQQQAQAASEMLASQQLDAQSTATTQANLIAYNAALGDTASKVGTAVAQIYSAESQLPAQALSAATLQNQTALSSSAAVAAAGVSAVPDYLNAAANLTAASYLPIDSYGKNIASMVSSVQQSGSNILNAVAQSANSSANAAASSASVAAGANAQRGSNVVGGAVTGASVGAAFGPWGAAAGGVIGGAAALL